MPVPKPRYSVRFNPAAPLRVAVVVNATAGGVSRSTLERLRRLLRREALFVTGSPQEVTSVARWIVHQRFDVVLCGGGDGTFSRCASELFAASPRLPALGVLRLGTGNALADTLAAPPASAAGLRRSLRRAARAAQQRPLSLLTIEGQLSPFLGLGADALILEDFNRVKRALRRTPLHPLVRGRGGYALALALCSLWRLLLGRRPRVTVRASGAPARRLAPDGQPLGPSIPAGGVLYNGPAALVAASTIPHYGFGFRLFPQAERLSGPRFQLRVINSSVLSVLARLPQLCRGQLVDPGIHDFACSAVNVELDRPTPFQIGGDGAGRRSRVEIGVTQVRAVEY